MNNKTLNNPIKKNKPFNIFKWSSELNSIDESIRKQDVIIRDANQLINNANNRKNQFKQDKIILMNQGIFKK